MKNGRIWGILIIGVVLRVLAAAFLYHTDGKAIYRDARGIEAGVVSAYRENAKVGNPLPYPPLVYEIFNNYQRRLRFVFSPYFEKWMGDWSTLSTENHPKIFRDLLVMKLPMLLIDLAVAWLLWKMASKERKKLAVFLWLLNPVTIYAIYGTGQFDIMPTFLILLGVYAWSTKKEWLTYCLFGLAGGLKLFPLLLIPILLLLDKRSLEAKIFGVVLSGIVFGLTFLPTKFALDVIKGIFTSNLADSMFKAGIDLGNNAFLPISLLAYASILIYVWVAKNKPQLTEILLITLVLILALTRFHPQWIVWISPFFILLLAEGRVDYKVGIWMCLAYFGSMLLIFDKFTNFGQLKAINNAFDTLYPLRFYMDKTGIGGQLYGLSIASFLAGAIAIAYLLITKKGVDGDLGKSKIASKGVLAFATWILGSATVFGLVHVPLTLFGRYLDFETSTQNVVIPMTAKTVLVQEIHVSNNNLFLIQLLIKNINLRTRTDLVWSLSTEDKKVVAYGVINGTAIGDDYDLNIQFPKIADSKGKTYLLELSAPGTITEEEFVFPYDEKAINGFFVDGTPTGTLAYRTFFNPGGYWDNLSYSLKNIVRRF